MPILKSVIVASVVAESEKNDQLKDDDEIKISESGLSPSQIESNT